MDLQLWPMQVQLSAVPDETVIPKLVEDKIPEAESIVFLDELDDSQSKASSHRKRGAESINEREEKTSVLSKAH